MTKELRVLNVLARQLHNLALNSLMSFSLHTLRRVRVRIPFNEINHCSVVVTKY